MADITMISAHSIAKAVAGAVKGLKDPVFRILSKDCGCFSATKPDGKRFSLTVDHSMIPPLFVFGSYVVIGGWDDHSIAAYIVRELER